MRRGVLALAALAAFTLPLAAQPAGPVHGSLLIVGGGKIGPEIAARFAELAGGIDSPVVVIPTAEAREDYPSSWAAGVFPGNLGMKRVTVLHTRSKQAANSDAFVAPLKTARGVWFTGGRQWRLVDSYLGTKVERELWNLLARGGVIGGTSAGATIQGSYLVRGAREGNVIMMAPGYEVGFGFVKNVAIDQHLLARHREKDLIAVVDAHPELLGIGIDESTAIVVQRDRFVVIGASKVGIYERAKTVLFLAPGDLYDLAARRRLSKSAH